MILHAHELCPAIFLSNELHLGKLSTPHAAGTDVPNFPRLHQVVQRLHRLLYGCSGIESVDLKKVDVRSVQPLQRCLYLIEDRSSGQTPLVLVVLRFVDLLAVVEVTSLYKVGRSSAMRP